MAQYDGVGLRNGVQPQLGQGSAGSNLAALLQQLMASQGGGMGGKVVAPGDPNAGMPGMPGVQRPPSGLGNRVIMLLKMLAGGGGP